MQKSASIIIDSDFRIGAVDDRIYGSFIEYVGRTINNGIHEPGHPTADDLGFRRDVIDVVRELNVPIYRYPGGCYASIYRWEDGVGPVEERPRRLDPMWRSIEPNAVGLNEFAEWTRRTNGTIMNVVNLATRGIEAAMDLVEYCNHDSGTYWSDLRVAHGVREPHAIKLWGLDNEQDGPWEVGHRPAEQYAWCAREAAKVMRWVDPSIEIAINGSSHCGMSSFPEWDASVLDAAYDVVDYISVHQYLGNNAMANPPVSLGTPYNDIGTYLARSLDMDDFIEKTIATCDYVRAKLRRKRRMYISLDEWNVWYHTNEGDIPTHPRSLLDPQRNEWLPPVKPRGTIDDLIPWSVGWPLMEEIYTMADALVVGCMLISLLKHADRVKIACLTSAVNNVAPIMTVPGGAVWRQTTYYPFLHASLFGRGVALDVQLRAPVYDSPYYGQVSAIEAVAVLGNEAEQLAIFAVNRTASTLEVDADLRGVATYEVHRHLALMHEDLEARNTSDEPEKVIPQRIPGACVCDGHLRAGLPAYSWNVIVLGPHKETSD